MRLLAAAVIFGASLSSHLTDTPQVTPGPTVKPRPRPAQAAPRRLPTSRHEHRKPLRTKVTPWPWNSLARCESGGDWHDTAGMFDGGLQFLAQTWDAFGGRRYAPTADEATKAQQITVAERVQAVQGWGAWPRCSVAVGLR